LLLPLSADPGRDPSLLFGRSTSLFLWTNPISSRGVGEAAPVISHRNEVRFQQNIILTRNEGQKS
jgi:hypothetical protein